MRILSFISVALLGMVFMVSANQVQAREAWDWYTSFSAGVVIPQETDVEVNGRTVETREYDAGYDISGAVGLYMGSNFRLELAIGGREYEVSGGRIVAPVTGTPLDNEGERALDVDGNPGFFRVVGLEDVGLENDDVVLAIADQEVTFRGENVEFVPLISRGATLSAVSFMTNGYWDILGVSNPFEPYIGFGVGVAIWEIDDSFVSGSVAAFMLNTMVGANYHINDHLAFGTSYRFTWSNPEDDEVAGLGELAFEQFNHSILGTVTVVF